MININFGCCKGYPRESTLINKGRPSTRRQNIIFYEFLVYTFEMSTERGTQLTAARQYLDVILDWCAVGILIFGVVVLRLVRWTRRGNAKRVCVVVLGDIGRSPRMQYHSLSLADAGYDVSLIGYAGSILCLFFRPAGRCLQLVRPIRGRQSERGLLSSISLIH